MRTTMKSLTLAGATFFLMVGLAWADMAGEMDAAGGKILVNEKGMALYTFDKDTKGTSNCYDQCATNWPPLMADGMAMAKGEYSVVARKDGSKQWAYKGMPLYLWVKDTKAGDMTGDGVKGVWHVARP